MVVPRSSRGSLADPSLALSLPLGLPVTEVDDFSEVEFPGGKVTATLFLGQHADLDVHAKSTYVARFADKTVSGYRKRPMVHATATYAGGHQREPAGTTRQRQPVLTRAWPTAMVSATRSSGALPTEKPCCDAKGHDDVGGEHG